MSYVPHPQATEGGQDKMIVSDMEVRQLLLRILNQMKINNIHLSEISGEEITIEEV